MSSVHYSLSALVASTPHLLAYAIPLLLLSLLLTFAGTFLTLDRSRSFPSSSSYASVTLPGAFDSPKKKAKLTWALQGGIGGLASGYIFGLHLSTFLALLVPSISSSPPLTPNSFLAVWILSAIVTTVLGGRYRYCALVFSAISGGALLALGLSVIIHPSLLPRQVLIVLFTVLLLILILLFSLPRLARFLHPTFRVTTASSGAFSLVLAIALLSHIPAWADVWERLWLHDGESWGTPKEKGLSAAFCIFLSVGSGIDWFLNKWLGECPDEKWDNYLANYAANLPNDASRAGSFKPLTPNSLWHRLFHSPSKKDKDDILFPPSPLSPFKQPRGSISKDAAALLPNDDDDAYSKYPVSSKPDTLYDLPTLPSSPGFLKKARSQKMYKPSKKKRSKKGIPSTSGRKHIKFGVDLSSDSSESDSETGNFRPWMNQKPSLTSSSSTPTLVNGRESRAIDYELELAKLKKDRTKAGGDGGLDYSDYEEDLGSPRGSKERERHDAGWSPGFMKRHSTASTSTGGVSRNGAGKGVSNPNVTLPPGAVPATPSLIKALDRISAAQQDAFGIGGRSVSPARTHSPLRRTPVASVVKGKQKLDGMPQMEDLDSSDDEEGARRKEREQRAPRWEEFWRNVKAKAES